MMQVPDALIFDMDGTLWDAIVSYCEVWDATAAQLGIDRHVSYEELLPLMGRPLEYIYNCLMGHTGTQRERFMRRLASNEATMMPRLGGQLYPGVRTTLTQLRNRGTELFMVSNCSASGLDNFLDFTRLRSLFTDALSFGATGHDKDVNLRHLRDCYKLSRPMYVGDVQHDADAAHAANMPFIWAAYGFGDVAGADLRIDSFDQLLHLWN